MAEIYRNWIRKNPDQPWAPPHLEPVRLYSQENISESLNVMRAEAKEIGVERGVGFIAVWPFFCTAPSVTFTVIRKFERDPNPDKENDIGTNYFGIAMQKLAYMLSTHEDSGGSARPLKSGEVPFKGGLTITTEEGSGIYFGYSGGTEEQDVLIARKGLESFIQLSEED